MNQAQTPILPQLTTRKVVYATLLILTVVIIFWILYRFSWVLFVLFIAVVMGTAIRPAVDWLNQHGVKRIRAVLFFYLVFLLLFILFVALSAPLVLEQSTEITRTLNHYYGLLRNSLSQSRGIIVRQLAARLPIDFNLLAQPVAAEDDLVTKVAGFMVSIAAFSRGILYMIAIFLLGFYWTLEGERILRGFTFWLPINRRDGIRQLIAHIEAQVGGFILGQSILCLVIGVMAFIAYTLIGLPNVLALAIIAGVFEAVPVVGPAIGAIPAFIIALSIDPSRAILVVVSTMLIQALENSLLVPRVMKRSVGINPIITLLALATFTSLFGLPGALLAIPIGAIIQLLLDRYLITPGAIETQVSLGRDQLSLIRYEAQELVEDVRKQLRRRPDQPDEHTDQLEDEIEGILSDLTHILLEIAEEGSSL